MGVNIKNEEAERLIRELARLIGKGQTEAVTQAVRGEIARVNQAAAPQSDRGLAEELLAIGHETAPLFKEPFKSMDHGEFLHDEETGLPK